MEPLVLVWNSLPFLLKGTVVTLELTFLLLVVGLAVGILLALGQVYGGKGLVLLSSTYEQIFRSIPALVLLFFFFFGSPFLGLNISAFLSAVLALGFRSSAYQSQIFRGAIQSIKQGQMIAARSLEMSKFQAIRHIILPQALRLSLPPWSNEYSSVVKDTSLAYAVGVIELVREGRYIIVRTFEPMIIYITIAVIYFILTYAGNKSLGYLEEKLKIPGFETKSRKE
ncbi:amino acid ABC transporter permease [Candidatus Aerophobetes bacterium]|nr:amino acid ABC transporter permease [Candidatus Aerophobetes bacterium]